jgi:N-acyl-D-amino-acid deacylase
VPAIMKRPSMVIRNGYLIDGLGSSPRLADIAISNGRISGVGKIDEVGHEEIDAAGSFVTPGFVDVHTHYDGQAVWGERFAPSSSHGVTTVVMGNCGVGFAPCRQEDHDVLVSVMEGVEDVPEIVMTRGLDWSWESFPEFLDVIENRSHDIDFAVYLPHSPLRVYVMGERGVRREPANDDDLVRMKRLVEEALDAGALGFATSNISAHRTGEGEYIPSYSSGEREYMAVADAMRESGRGVFQMVLDQRQPAKSESYVPLLERVSKASGRTVTFTMTQMMDLPPDTFKQVLAAVHDANAHAGVAIRPQIFPRPMGMMLGHDLTLNPFSLCPSYDALKALPLEQRIAALLTPDMREKLLAEMPDDPTNPLFIIARDWSRLYPFRTPADYEPAPSNSLAELAKASGVRPEEIAYDLLLERDGHAMILATLTNYAAGSLEAVREMMEHEDTVVALGDGGAHYGLICDASFPTFVLTHWTRDRGHGRIDISDAIRALTSVPAKLVGLADRGILATGYKADINIIDMKQLELEMPRVTRDLPGGGRRLDQRANGYKATIVSGELIQRDGVRTNKLPGRLVRGAQSAPA